uniref:TRUD domain-containing protein n=1 Tax=Lygus hesperus TaxID=30085 RepID=A0A0A9Y832_LYGHE
MQRFGTYEIPSHVFGWYMIRRDFKNLVQSILYNVSYRDDTLHCLQSGDAITMWKRLPDTSERMVCCIYLLPWSVGYVHMYKKKNCKNIHTQILKHLIEQNARDFESAFRRMPRLLRMLYLHAYQSYIFNTAASLRFDVAFVQSRRPELTANDIWKALEGDLVMVDSNIHVVSREDEANEVYKVTQVVLPLVGSVESLPKTNLVCEPVDELLLSQGVDLHALRRAFEVEHLVQPNQRWEPQYRYLCVQSDLQVTLDDDASTTESTVPGLHTLHLSFSLPPSAYATVALAPLIGFC